MVVHVAPMGRDGAGLARYLYGAGKQNEHTDQHMVAGSQHLALAYPGALDKYEAAELGRVVEQSWKAQRVVELAGAPAIAGSVAATGEQQFDVPDDPQHMYHLIVSLPPGNQWTDEQWAIVANEVVEGMGFTTGPDDEKGCRWYAMRHGLSENGNEHMHIAVNLVRQDGYRANIKGDWPRSQQVRRDIEKRHDFVLPLHPENGQKIGLPAYTMAEHQLTKKNAAERGHEIPDRVRLQHVVRAASETAATEAEWVRAVRGALPGVQLATARSTQDGQVTGYRVRLDEGAWFTGSQLARDLTLPKLRPGWEANETDASRAEAAALWASDQPVAAPGEGVDVGAVLSRADQELREWGTRIEAIPSSDDAALRSEMRGLAGTVSVLAGGEGQLSEGMTWAEGFAVAGQSATRAYLAMPDPGGAGFVRSAPAGSAARSLQLALRAGSPDSHRGWLAVMQQLNRLARSMSDARAARGELAAVRQLHDLVEITEAARLALGDDYGNVRADQFAYDPELAEVVRTRERAAGGPRTGSGSTGGAPTPDRSGSMAPPRIPNRSDGQDNGPHRGR